VEPFDFFREGCLKVALFDFFLEAYFDMERRGKVDSQREDIHLRQVGNYRRSNREKGEKIDYNLCWKKNHRWME
jgi:hypothetical protein